MATTTTLNNGCFCDEHVTLSEPTVLELMFLKGSSIADAKLGTAGDGKYHYAKLGDGFCFVPVGHEGIVWNNGRAYMLFEPQAQMSVELYMSLLQK